MVDIENGTVQPVGADGTQLARAPGTTADIPKARDIAIVVFVIIGISPISMLRPTHLFM
jgi:hypothetical protein